MQFHISHAIYDTFCPVFFVPAQVTIFHPVNSRRRRRNRPDFRLRESLGIVGLPAQQITSNI